MSKKRLPGWDGAGGGTSVRLDDVNVGWQGLLRRNGQKRRPLLEYYAGTVCRL